MGDATWELEQGDFVYVPRDVGDAPAEIVQYQWPGGFHAAYAELAAVFANGKPSFQVLEDVARRHNITLHGPRLRAMQERGAAARAE